MKKLWNNILLAAFACVVFPMAIIIGAKWGYRCCRYGLTLDEAQTKYEHEVERRGHHLAKMFARIEL